MVSATTLLLILTGLAATASAAGKQPGERQLAVLRRQVDVAVDPTGNNNDGAALETLVLAAGCFWGVQLAFERLPGVASTEVGYIGGKTEAPTYGQVSRGNTGHAEAVRVTYDSTAISLESLLDVFFDCHDPTTLNRQGNDVGTQYRSALFYASDEERIAMSGARFREQVRRGEEIATSLELRGTFTPAEDHHQNYLALRGQASAKGSEEPIRCYG